MKGLRLAALIGSSMFAWAAPALAQEQEILGPPADVTGGEQDVVPGGEPEVAFTQNDAAAIVVEARRRGESVQDVPLVVNAVTAEKINELNLRDFRDIQTVVPGLTMNNNSNGTGTTSSVRGVNFDVNASGAFGTIEYYLNDSPITSGVVFNALFDIGQIEVLRGPQGTLRGKASPSGSITIAHRKPDLDEVGGYVLSTVNDIGGANVNGAVGAPIIPGMLAVRVAGLVERGRGTRVRSINNPADPFTRTKAGRVFLRFEPTDWINAEGVYQRVETRARQFDQVACFEPFNQRANPGAAAVPCPVVIEPEDRLAIKKAPIESEQTFDIFTWKASIGQWGQRLYYNGQYSEQKIDNYQPQGGAIGAGDDANIVAVPYCATCTSNRSTFEVHEVRLQSDERIAGLFDYVVGYFNFKQNSPSYLFNTTANNTAGTSFRTSATLRFSSVKEESYFGNLTAHLGQRTELSGGARRIKVVQDSGLISSVPAGCSSSPATGLFNCPFNPILSGPTNLVPIVSGGTLTNVPIPGVINPSTFKKTIFSASAKHRFSDDLMVYANFGTSFRPGNNVVRIPANARTTAATDGRFLFLPAETSKSYEIGFKSEFFDDTVKLNVTAYQQDFKNYPFRSSSGVPALRYNTAAPPATGADELPQVQNVNFVAPVPVRVRGFEAELEWRPNDRIYVSANVSYALGKIRGGAVPCLDLAGPDGTGAPDGIPDRSTALTGAALRDRLLAVTNGQFVSTCQVRFRSSSAPPWGANVQAEYSLPMLNDAAEGFIRGLASYNGSADNDPQNFFDDYGAYARLNLYAGLRDPDGAWEVTVFGKNIFDDNTVLATSNGLAATTIGATQVVSPGGYIGLSTPSTPGLSAPREFGVTARFAFGSR